jgi:FdrA protein
MTDAVEVRRGTYRDSVTLMQVSRAVNGVEGVEAALVAMATDLNRELLASMAFDLPADAGPNDLVVAIRGTDGAALDRGRARLAEELAGQGGHPGAGPAEIVPPRTVRAAARRAPDASLALVSVPGPYAFAEAMDALDAGMSVMVFSDNVPIDQEVRLKDIAAQRGLLVMGPDCGTAVVGGVGLGFANVVRPGPVGLVAASGTGAQQVMCLLDAAGVGVTHVLGVGGRDLSAEVGGRSTVAALALLDADPATERIVLISKPPAPTMAELVSAIVVGLGTPTVLGLLGPGQDDLTAVVAEAVGGARSWPEWPAPEPQQPRPGALRGLYSGGTLCDEAMVIASAVLGPVRSNIPLRPEWALPPDLAAGGHLMIDFGDDALTRGRPHPMIDTSLRIERLAAEGRDPSVGVVLLDVVLGHGADPDPAATLAPAISSARQTAARDGRDLAIVVALCGTAGDPQGLERQANALQAAGAHVFLSNAAAARHAVALVADK